MKEDILNKLENIKRTKVENKNRDFLLKIIQLNECVKEKKIIEDIIEEIKRKEIDKENLYFIDIRLDSLIEESAKKNYNEKTTNNTITLYKYENKNVLYINKKNKNQEVLDILNKLEYKFLHLYAKNEWIKKKELSTMQISDLDNIDKVVNSTL